MDKMKKINEKLRKFSLEPAYLVLFVFFMLIISKLAVNMLSESGNEYLALVILQLMTFGLPGAVWCRLRALPNFRLSSGKYSERLRLTPPKFSHLWITFAAVLALISGCLLLSINFSGESSLEGSFSLYDTFISKYNATPLGAIWLILAYAALPAFGEELIFRGIICAEYEKHGVIVSIAMSSLWFGFLHFNFAKLTVYIFAGAVLSLLLYATRSLITVMIAHFVYNLFGIFGQQYITEFYITAGSVGISIMILIAILLIAAVIFSGCAGKLYSGYAKRDEPSAYIEPTGKSLLASFRTVLLTPAAAICVVTFLAVTVIQLILN